MRMAERAMARRAAQRRRRRPARRPTTPTRTRCARRATRGRRRSIARERGSTYAALRALTCAMKLDLLLFGRIRSGPFFALLRRRMTRGRRPVARDEDPLLRHRPDACPARPAGSVARARRWPRGWRRSGTRCTSLVTPGDGPFPAARRVRWVAMPPPLGSHAPAAGATRRGRARSRAASGPTSIIERYHNFGGEGDLAARGARRRGGARGERAGHRPPGLAEGARSIALLLVEPMRRWRERLVRASPTSS